MRVLHTYVLRCSVGFCFFNPNASPNCTRYLDSWADTAGLPTQGQCVHRARFGPPPIPPYCLPCCHCHTHACMLLHLLPLVLHSLHAPATLDAACCPAALLQSCPCLMLLSLPGSFVHVIRASPLADVVECPCANSLIFCLPWALSGASIRIPTLPPSLTPTLQRAVVSVQFQVIAEMVRQRQHYRCCCLLTLTMQRTHYLASDMRSTHLE